MNATSIPRCFRGSLAESRAYEQGEKAGRAGVAAGGNPWLEGGSERVLLDPVAASFSTTMHYARPGKAHTLCGLLVYDDEWNPARDARECLNCVRAVETERKRLERSWEAGRSHTHPK